MTPADFLLHLLGESPALVPIYVQGTKTRDGRKGVYPSPVMDAADLQALVAQHLAGRIEPRTCSRIDGTTWRESRAYGIGSYALRRSASGPVCGWIPTTRSAWRRPLVGRAGEGRHRSRPVTPPVDAYSPVKTDMVSLVILVIDSFIG